MDCPWGCAHSMGGMGEEKDIKGFLDAMLFQLNNSFNKFNSFIEEKILNPLKDKLGVDEDKSLFKGLMEKFGIDEKIQNAKDWMKDVTAGVRENLKAVYTDVKDRLVSSYLDLYVKICSNNEEGCNKAKDIFSDIKDNCKIGWSFIKKLASDGGNKLKDWYEIYSGKR